MAMEAHLGDDVSPSQGKPGTAGHSQEPGRGKEGLSPHLQKAWPCLPPTLYLKPPELWEYMLFEAILFVDLGN